MDEGEDEYCPGAEGRKEEEWIDAQTSADLGSWLREAANALGIITEALPATTATRQGATAPLLDFGQASLNFMNVDLRGLAQNCAAIVADLKAGDLLAALNNDETVAAWSAAERASEQQSIDDALAPCPAPPGGG